MNNRFKILRESLGITQKDLAHTLGRTPTMIQYYEYGTRKITDGVLLQLHELFNVNIDWMRTGNGEMFVEKAETVPSTPALDEPFSRVKTFAYSAIRNMSDAEVQDLLKYIEDQKILKEHRQLSELRDMAKNNKKKQVG